MPANVETMFSVRETPWHGLGRIIMDAPASREALELAGLDWQVESRNIYSGTGSMIPGYRANVRSTDDAVLGVVSDRYRIVQNEEAFQFTDDLLGEGVTYETAGSLQGGKKVWMLARLPRKYLIAGDQVVPYLVIFNSHDGSSGVKVAMTPIRVVCQNTLNLALNTAKRSWTARHTENVLLRVQDARETLQLASNYIKRDTVPDGLSAYDVRHDDECRGIPCEIAPFVMVNHWGTIILAEPLELPDDGRRYIDEDTDWNYAPLDGEDTANHKPCTTISDFMTAYAH